MAFTTELAIMIGQRQSQVSPPKSCVVTIHVTHTLFLCINHVRCGNALRHRTAKPTGNLRIHRNVKRYGILLVPMSVKLYKTAEHAIIR